MKLVLFLDRIKTFGVVRSGVLGGEPLYRKDIIEILSLAKKKVFFISLNTNLLIYNEFKDKLSCVDYFFTSIDGRPELHIQNRGEQSFEKILKSIQDIRSKGKDLTVICVINKQTVDDIDYLLQLAIKEKIQVHFQPECFDIEIVGNKSEVYGSLEELRNIWMYILDQKRNGFPVASSISYLEKIINWNDYNIISIFNDSKSCSGGRGFLFIDASGIAYPCAYTKGKMKGVNLLKEEWRSQFNKRTPCSEYIVGPMLEFNLLFDKPISSVFNALTNYQLWDITMN